MADDIVQKSMQAACVHDWKFVPNSNPADAFYVCRRCEYYWAEYNMRGDENPFPRPVRGTTKP